MVRAKVRLEFPEKLFYEKLLLDWKESIADRNHGYVIRKALDNIKRFPLAINGYNELRKIKGIGEHIATHLDAAWKRACETRFSTVAPTVSQVRGLKRGELLPFLEQAFVSKGRRDAIPFLQRTNNGGPSSSQAVAGHHGSGDLPACSSKTMSQPLPEHDVDSSDDVDDVQEEDSFNKSFSQPTGSNIEKGNAASLRTGISQAAAPNTIFNPMNTNSNSTITMISSSGSGVVIQSPIEATQNTGGECNGTMLSYDPAFFTRCKLTLIVDGREQNCAKGGGNRNRTSITQHLDKLTVPFEVRTLAVGDYLWTLRMENGVDEMVLDYVVERKTWDDLRVSIRQTRYSEQKKRLRESGIRNVVLLVEGQPTSDRGLEQALASTSVDNHFLVHRTLSIQGTAKFLKTLTDRLSKRLEHEHMCGSSFETLQNESRKMKVFSVHDCWIRQLTVCPLMSTEKAKLIANHFPTLRTLATFYKRKVDEAKEAGRTLNFPALLHDEINDVPKSLSAQMALFFEKYCCQ